MSYINEYKKIFQGQKFIRNDQETDLSQHRVFDGGGFRVLIDHMLKELESRPSVSVLDYGCGEGLHWHQQTLLKNTKSLPNLLGKKLQNFYRYDPAYEIYGQKPQTKFDFVICSDVLEHIVDSDLPEFFSDINQFVKRDGIIFYSISTTLSKNKFLDGTNMHVNIKAPEHWFEILKSNAKSKFCVVFNGKHNYY
jgi:2-polyprenyl-3-methyl-5-hydroxy-6-metoxy-1,4-benzoquinol methylase